MSSDNVSRTARLKRIYTSLANAEALEAMTEHAETLEHELTALRKEREWRPMETAPFFTDVLIRVDGNKKGVCAALFSGHWRAANGLVFTPGSITGWLPLPDTQAITGGEG